MKQEAILPGLDDWLASVFEAELRKQLAECDRTLAAHRSVLKDQPDTAAEAGKWIAETMKERRRIERQLNTKSPNAKLTKDDVRALVTSLQDIVATLADADADDRAEVYAELGISLTYHRDGRVLVESRPHVPQVRVGGRITPLRTRFELA